MIFRPTWPAWRPTRDTAVVDLRACQDPLPDRAEGEWWATMEEVFHQDWEK